MRSILIPINAVFKRPERSSANWVFGRKSLEKDGGADGVRTPDLLNAIQELGLYLLE